MNRRSPARRRRWPWITLGAVSIAAIAGSGLIVFGGTQLLLTPHHDVTTHAGTVLELGGGQVTLKKMAATERVGSYGLIWDTDAGPGTGTATIGPVLSSTTDTVIRPISDIVGELAAGTTVTLNPNIYNGDPQSSLGIPFSTVNVEGELGPMPAWQIDGQGSTWVLFIHGIDGERESGLRPLPTLVNAGLPTLLISYRNDADAPASPSGLIALGQTEWRDLESAADFALSQGATQFVLYGDSMGGSIATRFVRESVHADKVRGLILDSPVLNWSGVLQGQADRFTLPFLSAPLQSVVAWRGGIDLDDLDELEHTASFTHLPVLLFQGLSDPLVPPAESEQFAGALPNAHYVPVASAGHIQSWNVDPSAYEQNLADFVRQFSPAS